MNETGHDYLKPGCLNFISPFGLGDTLRLAGLKSALEEKYHTPLHFVINESHRIIMTLYGYGIDDFSVHHFSKEELENIGKEYPVPRRGFPYVAHPVYSDRSGLIERWEKTPFHVEELFERFLGLEQGVQMKAPCHYPAPVEGLEKTVLLIPEAKSVPGISDRYWRGLAAQLRKAGYTVMQNYLQRGNGIRGVPVVEGSLEEVTAYALSCGKVYSVRNGLCDLLLWKVQRMCVLYPNEYTKTVYGMKRAFPEQDLEEELAEEKVPRRGVVRLAKGAVKKVLRGMGILKYAL
jgi:hypothetical protein